MLKAFAGSSRSTATCIARPAGLLKPASFYFFRCRQPGFRLKIATSFGLIIVPSGVRLCKRALAENASAAGPQANVNVMATETRTHGEKIGNKKAKAFSRESARMNANQENRQKCQNQRPRSRQKRYLPHRSRPKVSYLS